VTKTKLIFPEDIYDEINILAMAYNFRLSTWYQSAKCPRKMVHLHIQVHVTPNLHFTVKPVFYEAT